ncbi:sigma-70 family RNA polymerase sigma factor [Patescibacteria group bacterium]|nr:sigma-70 family RNA polymerase sigma factor [Patescibacteria group bacterium]MBP9710559.1 sigma-70 family RNA polymerase sigma factor [Patescibacteria group bacterium]
MDHATDTDLIRLSQQGDETALAFLIERYASSVYRFLARMLNDRLIAEDLTQETFIKVWKSLSRFDPTKAFKPWLFSIARNTAIDHVRKKHPFSFSSLEDEEDRSFTESVADVRLLPSSLLEQKDLGDQLTQALTHLSPIARSIVLMHETEDLTFQEIADMLKEPLNTVKSRYRRALLALQTKLTPEGDLLLPSKIAPK